MNKRNRRDLRRIGNLGLCLPPDEQKKLHARFAALLRQAKTRKDWPAVGMLTGLLGQVEIIEETHRRLLSYLNISALYDDPASQTSANLRRKQNRRKRKEPIEGQLALRFAAMENGSG